MKVLGIVRGRHIEIERPVVGLPEGFPVSLEVRPREIPLEEKHRLLDELSGSWADDDSLGPIFEEIQRQRRASAARPVSFDEAT